MSAPDMHMAGGGASAGLHAEAGGLLREFRKRKELTREQFAELLPKQPIGSPKITAKDIKRQEEGIDLIPYRLLEPYKEILGLDDNEYGSLCRARREVFPIIKPSVLEGRLSEKRAGLLFEAYCELHGYSSESFGQCKGIGVSGAAIYKWKKGETLIPVDKVITVKNLLNLTESQFRDFCYKRFPALYKLHDTGAIDESSHAELMDAYNVLKQVEPNQGVLSPDDMKLLQKRSMPALFNPLWLDTQPADKQAGLMVRDACALAGYSPEQFAKFYGIDVEPSTVKAWMNGDYAVTGSKILAVKQLLGLEKLGLGLEFYHRRFPVLKTLHKPDEVYKIPHQDRIDAYHAMKYIAHDEGGLTLAELELLKKRAFPALFDTKWLIAQPSSNRPGLIIRDGRELNEKTQEQLGADLHAATFGTLEENSAMSAKDAQSKLSKWERGEYDIPADILPILREKIPLTDEQAIELRKQRLRALDKKWLAKQPLHEQGGLVLRAYCDLAGMSQKMVKDGAGLKPSQMRSERIIWDDELDKLCKSFALANEALSHPADKWFDEKYLRHHVELSNTAILRLQEEKAAENKHAHKIKRHARRASLIDGAAPEGGGDDVQWQKRTRFKANHKGAAESMAPIDAGKQKRWSKCILKIDVEDGATPEGAIPPFRA